MSNKYYVYKHHSKNGKVYVGKGSGKRITDFNGRNTSTYWKRVFTKYHYICVETVKDGLTEAEAFALEISTIQEYIDKGYKLYERLINGTLGGEGCSGLKHSEETKAKMSKAKMGKPSKKKGVKIVNPTTLENMSKCQLGKKRSKEFGEAVSKRLTGVKRPKEVCKAISEGKKGVPVSKEVRKKISDTLSKPVKCIETGVTYASTKKAAEVTGINSSNISQVCRGKRKTAGSFTWEYK